MSAQSSSPTAVGDAFASSWAATLSPASGRALRAARVVLSLSVVLAATAAVWLAVVVAAAGTLALVRCPEMAAAALAAAAGRVGWRRLGLPARRERPAPAPPDVPAP